MKIKLLNNILEMLFFKGLATLTLSLLPLLSYICNTRSFCKKWIGRLLYGKHTRVMAAIFIRQGVTALLFSGSLAATAQMPANYQLKQDWLVNNANNKASITIDNKTGTITLSNGLLRRVIDKRLGTTVSYVNLMTGESIIRAVEPEGSITLDGVRYPIGGAKGQPDQAFLTAEWLHAMQPLPRALKLTGYKTGNPRERLKWKRLRHHAPDAVWPPRGAYLRLDYSMPEPNTESTTADVPKASDYGRKLLFTDTFQKRNKSWNIHISKAHQRSSFDNEGKPGEIYTPRHTAVYAERPLPAGIGLVEAEIHSGTDSSTSWGPGIGLVFSNGKKLKFYLRPGGLAGVNCPGLAVFDGRNQVPNVSGEQKIDLAGPWLLRARLAEGSIFFDAKPESGTWRNYYQITIPDDWGRPQLFRVGKMAGDGGKADSAKVGKLVRLRINKVAFYSGIDPARGVEAKPKKSSKHKIMVSVHYEVYDGVPVISKWITVTNGTAKTVNLDRFSAEILSVVEYVNRVESRSGVVLPKPRVLHVETDMAFGGFSHQSTNSHTVHWKTDKTFRTQVNYELKMPCLLQIAPTFGPDQTIRPGAVFKSFRVFELVYDSEDRERRGLALKRMYRTVAPWVTENPLMLHCRSSHEPTVRKAIDQAAKTGFELVILSFGSGFNSENNNPAYLAKWKKINDYAMSKGVQLGCYSLYSSRDAGRGNNIIPPKGLQNAHGRCPAITSQWGQDYIEKLYHLFDVTGFKAFENDGPYPGDVDVTPRPPLQKGMNDSRWVHWRIWTDFYKYLRSKGVYLNLPDYYYLSGSNKCGMGYRETNWSLPREQQRVHTRQNIYDGTWEKTPSMGWMFVPLTQYQGGGAAATVEPLNEHLDHYEIMMKSNLGLGVQACYRGPRLYDTEKTRNMVKNTVSWYKGHRAILESDLIHGRRADGQDIDWMLHVNPGLREKALLSVYNPTNHMITKTIMVPLYYSGLRKSAWMSINGKASTCLKMDNAARIKLTVTIPAQGYRYYIFW